MTYVDRVLLPNEQILFRGKIHWVLFMPAIIAFAIAIFCANYLDETMRSYQVFVKMIYSIWGRWPDVNGFGDNIALTATIIGIISAARAYVKTYYTEIVVTDRRIIAKYGFSTVTTIEMDRRKIAGVVVNQSLWGRILNFGRVLLRGFSGNISGLPPISNPHDLQKIVNF